METPGQQPSGQQGRGPAQPAFRNGALPRSSICQRFSLHQHGQYKIRYVTSLFVLCYLTYLLLAAWLSKLAVCCSAVDERAWRHQQLARSLQTGGAAQGDADFAFALQLALEDEAAVTPARGKTLFGCTPQGCRVSRIYICLNFCRGRTAG